MDKFVKPASNIILFDNIFGIVYPSRDEIVWKPYFKNIDAMYRKKIQILSKDTIVYHGSLNKTEKYEKTKPSYFGLDFPISAWILPESADNKYKKTGRMQRYGYVHVYKLKNPLKYEYIDEDMCVPLDPPNNIRCSKHPCVHAQVVYHGIPITSNNFIDIGTELTIPGHMIDNVLHYVGTHKLDIMILLANITIPYNSWQPEKAII
jgi:hypothetical protein